LKEEIKMQTRLLGAALLASAMVIPAYAQSSKTATSTAKVEAAHGEMWRASKLNGLDVYNDKNEKLGDINEVLIDKSGKVAGVVIGVGGFIGMGEHDIMVDMNKLKFVDEPVRTSASTKTESPASNSTNTGAAAKTSDAHRWYPDHAILTGADKDKLKSMPQFKYN
jgi:sporulation protein YlmC with PRC-barrel domain